MTSVATLQPFATARTRRQSRALQGPSCAEGLYARVFEDILEGQFTAGLSEDLLMQTYAAGRSEVQSPSRMPTRYGRCSRRGGWLKSVLSSRLAPQPLN